MPSGTFFLSNFLSNDGTGPILRFKNLGSGSTGNATLAEARSGAGTASRLLVDCGLGIRILTQRLAQAGLVPGELNGIFITHEHADHVGCVLSLALRARIPVWMSRGTFMATGELDFDGLLRLAPDTEPFTVGDLLLNPFTVPHDAREPLQLSCTDGDTRLGILTDLGHATPHVLAALQGCHTLLLESNHDPEMLRASAYPAFLQKRVRGPYGHLTNAAAAAIAQQVQHAGLRQVVAAHLSQQNNHPALARATLAEALGWEATQIGVADPLLGTDWLTV